jgi:hypothetical protein
MRIEQHNAKRKRHSRLPLADVGAQELLGDVIRPDLLFSRKLARPGLRRAPIPITAIAQ